jgi:uncharacterized membrane protein (Fun14 family)
MVDTLPTAVNSLIPQGLPIVSGGLVGFVLGWLCKKLVKIAIIGIGLILALLAYLEYNKSITVNWDIVNDQANIFLHIISSKTVEVVNNTAADLNAHGLNHVEAFPIFGTAIGFVPGFTFGIMR